MIQRRSFLGSILALAAAPSIVRASSLMPLWVPPKAIIWGDGVHDDAAGLAALFAGLPYVIKAASAGVIRRDEAGRVSIDRGDFFMTEALPMSTGMSVTNSRFKIDQALSKVKAAVVVSPKEGYFTLAGCQFLFKADSRL